MGIRLIVGVHSKGEKITAKAHGGMIDIQGVTVATVNEKVQLQKVETWFDPLEMFRQIAPKGVGNKEVVAPTEGKQEGTDTSDGQTGKAQEQAHTMAAGACPFVSGALGSDGQKSRSEEEKVKGSGEQTTMRDDGLVAGVATASITGSEETKVTREEMSKIEGGERDAMNKE